MFRILVAVLAVLLMCIPSQAVIRQLAAHPGVDELRISCDNNGGQFSISADGAGYGCQTSNCDGKGHSCTVACDNNNNCVGGTPSIVVHVGDLLGDHSFTTLAPPERFGLRHVSMQQVIKACRSVAGSIFGGGRDQYFCANPHCDPGIGPCYVECDLVKCTAAMPHKPAAGVTLTAILRAGDDVSHQYGPTEGATTHDSNGAPVAPAAAPQPPPVIIY